MRAKEVETCSVVNQFCRAPANLVPPTRARGVCFKCGGAVCSKCSSIRAIYGYNKARLCNDCQVILDGDDRVVMRRMNRLARGGVSGSRSMV